MKEQNPRKVNHIRFTSKKLCILLLVVTYIFIFISFLNRSVGNNDQTQRPAPISKLVLSSLILNTTACKIPRTDIIPKYFKTGNRRWHTHSTPKCGYEKLLAVIENDEDEILQLLPESLGSNSQCCLHEITRNTSNSDHGYNLSECTPLFEDSMNVSGKAMLLTQCGDSLNFEATFPTNIPSVQKKFDYWNNYFLTHNTQDEMIPISVLFIGIDSVSRSHAIRSLPKTISYMRSEMNFIDFQGYHSIAASTFHNFMAFLVGKTQTEVREDCATSRSSPFDQCPLIWRDFDKANYITMYVEDGDQTFNWGGQAGFTREPTDYYIHPLFEAIKPLRKKFSKVRNPKTGATDFLPCASNETVPNFVLRYTRRFVQKFQNTPFFTFTFFAYPFHDDIFSLSTMDNSFHDFFKHLNTMPELLDRTIIIWLSDHGDRNSFAQNYIEAFIERSMPPFFIRLPGALTRRHPDLADGVLFNSRKLTTAFDLHHTFHHLLNLNEPTSFTEFSPVEPDRSSLFIPVDESRNCEKQHLISGSCACNTDITSDLIKSSYVLTKLMANIQSKLNTIVQNSKYKNVCAKWEMDMRNVLLAQVLEKTPTYSDVLVKFSAKPKDAHFEAKVRIYHDESEADSIEILGSFNRINMYGNQSHCVENITYEDKEMKELCMCK